MLCGRAMTDPDKPSERRKAQDQLVAFILRMAESDRPPTPKDIAIAFWSERAKPTDPKDGRRRYLTPVKQHALALVRSGRLEYLRNGRPVDPDEARGIVRLRRTATG